MAEDPKSEHNDQGGTTDVQLGSGLWNYGARVVVGDPGNAFPKNVSFFQLCDVLHCLPVGFQSPQTISIYVF